MYEDDGRFASHFYIRGANSTNLIIAFKSDRSKSILVVIGKNSLG